MSSFWFFFFYVLKVYSQKYTVCRQKKRTSQIVERKKPSQEMAQFLQSPRAFWDSEYGLKLRGRVLCRGGSSLISFPENAKPLFWGQGHQEETAGFGTPRLIADLQVEHVFRRRRSDSYNLLQFRPHGGV